jgi:hypothetical protein
MNMSGRPKRAAKPPAKLLDIDAAHAQQQAPMQRGLGSKAGSPRASQRACAADLLESSDYEQPDGAGDVDASDREADAAMLEEEYAPPPRRTNTSRKRKAQQEEQYYPAGSVVEALCVGKVSGSNKGQYPNKEVMVDTGGTLGQLSAAIEKYAPRLAADFNTEEIFYWNGTGPRAMTTQVCAQQGGRQ